MCSRPTGSRRWAGSAWLWPSPVGSSSWPTSFWAATAKGVRAAVKADTLSIIAFQVGLFLGLWLYQEVVFSPGLPKTSAAYWMKMQLSMVLGFFTAWPVNAWLVRIGWKEKM
nr:MULTISPECIES: DUF4396 domain-containing protein [Streptomyces]